MNAKQYLSMLLVSSLGFFGCVSKEERIAFASEKDGDSEIYTVNLEGKINQLTKNKYPDKHPSASPDGRRIAYDSKEKSERNVYVMTSSGNGIRRLSNNMSTIPKWSSDGYNLTYITTDFDGLIMGIGVVDFGGKELRKTIEGGYLEVSPSWSPDGEKIVYASLDEESDKHPSIYIMNRDGSNRKKIVEVGSDPKWSPNNNTLAYLALDMPFVSSVFPFDGKPKVQLFLTSLKEEHNRRLTEFGNNTSYSWSPDGSKIVFTSDRNGNQELYITETKEENLPKWERTPLKRLTNNKWDDRDPLWSPCGKFIAFKSLRNKREELYVMNADGTNQKQLTEGYTPIGFCWIPIKK